MHRALHYYLHVLFFAVRDWLRPPAQRLAQAGLKAGQSVLDYGCGGGSYTLAAARLVGPQGRVYALDCEARATARVRRLAARAGLSNVAAIAGTVPSEVADGTIDVALLYDVYHCCGEPERVLAELYRVLRPGGLLSFLDHRTTVPAAVAQITAGGRFEQAAAAGETLAFRRR